MPVVERGGVRADGRPLAVGAAPPVSIYFLYGDWGCCFIIGSRPSVRVSFRSAEELGSCVCECVSLCECKAYKCVSLITNDVNTPI